MTVETVEVEVEVEVEESSGEFCIHSFYDSYFMISPLSIRR